MDWTDRETRTGHEWTRGDGTVVVTLRKTADARWAVTLDRLEQAPEGPGYDRETLPTREEALGVVERWRGEHDTA
ncbi:DUF7543 family protein [Halomarina litorea]|uniref:DUF7543 family protein n=1 Tax=Halomarina litorea TaxID=2961595 RepID=UPI0020C47AC5|nr:hypothetical protein [Halomarina sp. BCD28]